MRILVADDDTTGRTLLKSLLTKWGYEVIAVDNGKEALEVLTSSDAPSLALLDWMMPGRDGPDVCREVRACASPDDYTYIILLTSKNTVEDMVVGFDAGADDYIFKPFHRIELETRVKAGRRVVELHKRIMGMQEKLIEQARTDALTGALNRSGMFVEMQKSFELAVREELPLAVCMLDIDYFKNVNDTYGHQAGDEALRATVDCLKRTLRPYDLVGRFGGEEFLLVLPGAEGDIVNTVLERARRAIEESVIRSKAAEFTITASLGAVLVRGDYSVEDAISAADRALYDAKNGGRNRVEVFCGEELKRSMGS